MKILILLSHPYQYRQFEKSINHDKHDVSYVGTKKNIQTIPAHLKCFKFEIKAPLDTFEETKNVIGQKAHFDRIISLWERGLLDAAKLRKHWSVPGSTTEEILKVRHKVIMKTLVKNAGIEAPKFISVKDFFENKTASKTEKMWKGKTVLKPFLEWASAGIKIFDSFESAVNFLSENKKDYIASFEMEEFIDADICHLDGLVVDGKIVLHASGKYLTSNFDFAKGKVSLSVQIDPEKKLFGWAQKVVSAVGIKNGAIHLEFFQTPRGPVFLEIANRCGGGAFVNELELKTNVYLPAAETAVYIGDFSLYDWKKHYNENDFVYGSFNFPAHHLPKGYAKIINADFIKNHPNLVQLQFIKPNRKLYSEVTYQPGIVPITGTIKGKDEQSVTKMLYEIVDKVKVESVPKPILR
ncbi:MAG TPA: hypothetical protein VMW66_01850 [Elusimicrobiales bacterium]|nr:hypothetical protein [Elusimicrobiales bacterium]